MSGERYSVKVLQDCIDLQIKKGNDYQNAVSTVKQADYYRLGLNTIYDIMHAKMLRMRSLLETAEHDENAKVNFESISDSAKDLINYASFFASYAEGKMDGQNSNNDIFNRPKKPVYTFPDEPVLSPNIQAVVEVLNTDFGKPFNANRIISYVEDVERSKLEPVTDLPIEISEAAVEEISDLIKNIVIDNNNAIWPEVTEEEQAGDWSNHHESRW